VRELAELVAELTAPVTGARAEMDVRPLPQDDPRQRKPDITRARETLGWVPSVPLREGLMRTIAYFAERLSAEAGAGARTLGEPAPAALPVG
jgi:UDP-glucuronate decarboxylase